MSRFKRKEQKGELFPPKKRQMLAEKLGLRGDGRFMFIEGLDSYEDEYAKVSTAAKKQHPTLLRVIECDDKTFYDADSTEQLRRFNLGGYTRVLFTLEDGLDFKNDESTSAEGILNDKHVRTDGPAVTGFMSVFEKEGRRHTVIVMRRETGGSSDSPDIKCATKISALLHEIGHVDDFEKSITFKDKTWRIVDAEVYAHRFACRNLFERNYMLVLGYYLDGVKQMTESTSEYVKRAATQVVDSPDYENYRKAVATYQEKVAGLKAR